MNAILLAAGVGRRLRPFTDTSPKCLLTVGARHLLARTLDALVRAGIERTTIVVGHCAEQVVSAAGDRWGGMTVAYVSNPNYEEGSIVSLWHAQPMLDADVLVMDADVLFPAALLERLVRSPHRSCVLLDGRVDGSGEEMILFAAANRVWNIIRRGPNETPPPPPGVAAFDTVGESVGFLKLAATDARVLRTIVAQHVAAGQRGIDHEATYPALFTGCQVGFERVDDLPWTEIDFPGDVARAGEEIAPLIDALDANHPGHATP